MSATGLQDNKQKPKAQEGPQTGQRRKRKGQRQQAQALRRRKAPAGQQQQGGNTASASHRKRSPGQEGHSPGQKARGEARTARAQGQRTSRRGQGGQSQSQWNSGCETRGGEGPWPVSGMQSPPQISLISQSFLSPPTYIVFILLLPLGIKLFIWCQVYLLAVK